MTKKLLSEYRNRKQRIKKLQNDIEELRGKDVQTISGKVKSSMKEFPYIQCYETVQMGEPAELERIKAAVRKKEEEVMKLKELNREVEDFVSGITDPATKSIFEYYFIDGNEKVTQKEVAARLNGSRESIAAAIRRYKL